MPFWHAHVKQSSQIRHRNVVRAYRGALKGCIVVPSFLHTYALLPGAMAAGIASRYKTGPRLETYR